MNDRNSVNDKVEALGAGVSETVHDLLQEAKPLLHHAAERVTERVNEVTQKGVDAVCKGKHELEKSGRDMMENASHMIRHEPFKAMLVAAGVGAATILLVGLMTRSHARHRAEVN